MPIYHEDDGTPISTHSMLKTFRRCPKQTEYKYHMRLKPKVLGKPLRRGTWMHTLLETHYKGEDWREKHNQLTYAFADLFDEEKEAMGDLPTECARLMESYLWHYKEDPWIIHDVEFTLETTFPNGAIYRCKIDLLIENKYGLWLVDHKTHKKLPDFTFRLMDAQSALYIWCALRNKIPVQGFIWNYLRTKPPTVPTLIKSGARVSRWDKMDTDFPTAYKAIKEFGIDLAPYKQKLRMLKSHRYQPDTMQQSTFFRRDILEKSPDMLKRVATENYHTSLRMHEYDFDNTDAVERVVDRSCTYNCSYTDVCSLDLLGGNTTNLIKQRYTVGDPLEYYQDDRQDERVSLADG